MCDLYGLGAIRDELRMLEYVMLGSCTESGRCMIIINGANVYKSRQNSPTHHSVDLAYPTSSNTVNACKSIRKSPRFPSSPFTILSKRHKNTTPTKIKSHSTSYSLSQKHTRRLYIKKPNPTTKFYADTITQAQLTHRYELPNQ